jgi:hypothetical protein
VGSISQTRWPAALKATSVPTSSSRLPVERVLTVPSMFFVRML